MCGVTVFGEQATALLAKALLKDKDASVRKAAAASLGKLADWGLETARTALIDAIGNRRADAADVRAAIQACDDLLRFEGMGLRRSFPNVYVALNKGMLHEDADVRAVALARLVHLTKGDDFGFDPAADPKEQQGAIYRWQEWAVALSKQ